MICERFGSVFGAVFHHSGAIVTFRGEVCVGLSSSAAKRSEAVLEVVALTVQAITSSCLCALLEFALHLLRLLFVSSMKLSTIALILLLPVCLHIASMIL